VSDTAHGLQRAQAPSYILVVDDDVAIREALEAVLEDEGYVVQSAANGREALALLRAGEGPPAVILLDLMMPVMNGWEFRAAQQDDPILAQIPVVVISADRDVAAKAAALQVPRYLAKPVNLDVLLDMVRAHYC
jgi:two-component system chemotaxis response regulator CheY